MKCERLEQDVRFVIGMSPEEYNSFMKEVENAYVKLGGPDAIPTVLKLKDLLASTSR